MAKRPRGRRSRHPRQVAEGSRRIWGGTMMRHNDVCPDSVVFHNCCVAALVGFDMAAPGRLL